MVQPGLEERLTRLVDPQVDAVVPPADELWQRGRRWGRRSRLVNVGVALCTVALLAGIGVWGSQGLRHPGPVQPVDSGSGVGVPSRVHTNISSRMPYLAEPGALVAVTSWSHTTWWGRSEPAVAAVSARTGEYGFVRTPGMAGGEPALSPRGTHLAYWTAGTPSGSPNTTRNDGGTLTGVAVLDSVTGEVVRHEIETAHGLSDQELFWLDDQHLLVHPFHLLAGDDGPEEEQWASRGKDAFVLDASTGEVSPWRWAERLPVDGWLRSGDGVLVSERGDALVNHRTGRVLEVGLPADPADLVTSDGALSPDGDVARVVHGDKNTDTGLTTIWVARLARPGSAEKWREVPREGSYVHEALGWRDGRIVALTGGEEQALILVDPSDGEEETLVEYVEDDGRGDGSVGWSWATDLLQTADVVDSQEPVYPVNPLLVLGATAAVLTAAAIAVVGWRRRGHP
ncbi:hypothetical protein [Nocardioides gilvus]|uniref:hypothetical protein n=1 Tax=Nocardioides gilvus TaxID=1735589 RepID=UPI000D7458B0|nr:hypothetical protein [Nocardioides gilvus]